eukprot:m.240444 g.240444  ORF g.240444 m.240444 type:complete len:66 (+) comp26585_c1_seq14:2765-2962(+)
MICLSLHPRYACRACLFVCLAVSVSLVPIHIYCRVGLLQVSIGRLWITLQLAPCILLLFVSFASR